MESSTTHGATLEPNLVDTAERQPHRLARFGTPLVIVAAASVLAFVLAAPFVFWPAEDAAILFQYSRNLADHGVISYVADGQRAEGATDFLWMILLTIPCLVHIDPFVLTGLLNALALVLSAYLLVRLADLEVTPLRASLVVLLLSAMPAFSAAVFGFSVYVFGAALLVTVWYFVQQRDSALALSCLTLCLLRPDGVIFAAPLLAFRVFQSARPLRSLGSFVLWLGLPGALYFAWRWSYFGEFWPLPFLVKANSPRVLGLFVAETVLDSLPTLGGVVPLLVLACTSRAARRENVALLVSLIGLPTLFYLAMRLDQNVSDRFFYYLIVGTAVLVARNLEQLRVSKRAALAIGIVAYLAFLALPTARFRWAVLRDLDNSPTEFAQALAQRGLHGTLAVTEAGRLVYYSGWTGIDMWGLNTPEYARHLIQPDEVRSLNADLVVVHFPPTDDCMAVDRSTVPNEARTWDHMVANVVAGIDMSAYDLLMLPYEGPRLRVLRGRHGDGRHDCLFVRKDYPRHDELTQILTSLDALPYERYKAARPRD